MRHKILNHTFGEYIIIEVQWRRIFSFWKVRKVILNISPYEQVISDTGSNVAHVSFFDIFRMNNLIAYYHDKILVENEQVRSYHSYGEEE